MGFQDHLSLLIVILSSFINFFITVLVYLRNPRSATHKIFSLLGLSILFWLVLTYLSYRPWDTPTTLFLIRLSTFFAPLICLFFFLLAHTFPSAKLKLTRKRFTLLAIITSVVMILLISPFAFTELAYVNNFPSPTPGFGIIPFVLYVILTISAAIFILFKRLRHSIGVEKQQIKIVLLGILLMPGLIILTNVIPVTLFNNNTLVPLTPLYPLVFQLLTAYAIVKHRLMDIRFIIVRSIAYILLLLFIALGYIAILFDIAYFVNRGRPSIEALQDLVVPTLLALFFAISFQQLRRVFEKITDRIFYRDRYDSNELLWSLSRIMASTLYLTDLSNQILEKLLSEMRINYGSIVLVRDKSIFWVGSSGEVSKHPFNNADMYSLVYDSYHTTKHNEHIFIFEELPEGKIKRLMRKQDLTIVIPLTVRHELIGGLVLGQKASGEIYSSEDIDLLKIVAPEIAVAVRNALSYEEIKKFNITLENEVDRATHRLRKANKRLKELDHLKDEFVSIASHELRTPMTAIKSYLWMAINQPNQEIKEPLKRYLNISYNSTERLIRLVNDMLTVSRIERNKIELKLAPLNINEVVQLVFDELKITAQEKHIAFKFEHPKKKISVMGDKEKLREVVQNLVGNALKFTPENGKIIIETSEKGDTSQISVTDTASGIPKESLPDLFKKFSKIEYSYSKHSSQPGTGLGLYISKQIVSLHNGDIKVQSEVGVGSTFTVSLPLYKRKGGGKE